MKRYKKRGRKLWGPRRYMPSGVLYVRGYPFCDAAEWRSIQAESARRRRRLGWAMRSKKRAWESGVPERAAEFVNKLKALRGA